ncbi:MAG: alpha/beta hydrolase [Alphaproteobacteria bacterium]|nr:alpha/beta hydrolase [Alphaproteobacteria bacterium]
MAGQTHDFVTISGTRLELRRGGEGPPVLFLHGGAGNADWMPFMNRLAQRFDVIAPSHPGFDRSDTPDWLDSMSDLAYFYLDLLEALDLDGVHVIGHSLGGWLAAEIAVRSSARLATLTLVGAAGIHVPDVKKGDPFLWTPETLVRKLFFDQKRAEALLAQATSAEAADIAIKNRFTTAKLAWHPRFYNPDLRKWLHRIRLPTLVVWGAEDQIFPPAYGEAWRGLVAGATLTVFPACGHLPHVEKLDEFTAAFAAFINGAAQ